MGYNFKLLFLGCAFYLLLIIRSFIRRSYDKDNRLDYWIILFGIDKNLSVIIRIVRLVLNILMFFLILFFYSALSSERIPLDWLF